MMSAILAVLLQAATPAGGPQVTVSAQCDTHDNVINANLLVICLPGLELIGLGTLREPEAQRDGTFVHSVPYRAPHGTSLETMICGIDLIDFSLRSSTGATLNVNETRDDARYCLTKQFVVPAGEVILTLRTRTRHPALVVRSSVLPSPVAFVIPPATVILIPPPPPPPPVPPPVPPPPVF